MKRILLLVLILVGIAAQNFSQNVFDPNDPTVRYTAGASYGSAAKPDSNIVGLQKWVSVATNGVSTGTGSFDPSSYKAYFIRYFNARVSFRLKYPKSYANPDSAGKKYPVMLFMHGAGEVGCPSNGGIYNNEKQLSLGGKLFMDAVDDDKFDGFLFYPQLRSVDAGCWGEWGGGQSAYYNSIITIFDSLVKYVNADNDRLFVDGLSGGGIACWKMAEFFPTRIAGIAPTSAAGLVMNYGALVHLPVWLATGGKDTNPSPTMALYTETSFKNLGGTIRRSLYDDLGHASWYRHWREVDFLPFMNSVHKANPLIFFNRFEFCPDSAISSKLGITNGFYAYEWQKDSVTIATRINTANTIINNASIISFNGNEITVKAFGSYRVRFRRTATGPWSDWSPKPAVIKAKPITQTPPITVVGMKSSVLPSLDGKTSVQLQMPGGYQNYQWYRTTDNILVSNAQIYDAPAGSYKARYSEPFGCGTLFSPIFKVSSAAGTPKPDPAKNLSITAVSQTALRLDWSDNPNASVNETGFEIYRAVKAGGPYSLVRIAAQNAITIQDTALIPNTKYFYIIRSIGTNGAAAASNEAFAVTEIDNKAPTAPVNLEYKGSNSGTVFLKWGAGTDDVGIARYDIYVSGVKMYSTSDLSFPVANLDSLTSYTFVVRSVDKAGNASPASSQVIGYTHRQGLSYKYFNGTYNPNLPDFNTEPVAKDGITDTVNSDQAGLIRTQADNYAFLWQGRIYIPLSGTYTFETASDDGSKLYLDVPYSFSATALVNNDGAHSLGIKTGTKYLTQGYHSIAIGYAEISGADEEISIYWSSTGTGLARERIPKNFLALDDNYVGGGPLAQPSTLVATPVSYNKIRLNWKDNSSDETGFEIVRSTSMTGTFAAVFTSGANVTSYNDSGLVANTRYFYKVRAINTTGASPFEFSYTEANYKFNSTLTDANGTAAYTLTSTNTSYNSVDKAEGSHAVAIANSGSLSFNTGTGGFPSLGGYNRRSIALWIKPTVTSGKRMLIDIGGLDNGMALRFNNNDLIGGIASGSSRTAVTLSNFAGNTNWISGQWNHVALVYDATSITLYLNGVSVQSNTSLAFSTVANSVSPSRIGNTGNTNAFNDNTGYSTWTGSIDNLYIIRGALSASEIDSLRQNIFIPSSALTLAAPAAPVIPTALTATALNTDAVLLSWNDNSSDETGFEIWRSSGDKTNNRLIATVGAGDSSQILFTDTALFANITYYYKIRAKGISAPSDFTPEVSAITKNSKPAFKKVRDFTMRYATTVVLPVSASDVDGDLLTFTSANLPAFATIQNTSSGNFTITFSPSIARRGSYRITLYANDGNGGRDTSAFTLEVNSNDVPVLNGAKDSVINEGGRFLLPLTGTDNNGTAAMIWSFEGLPSFASFVNNNNGTGLLSFSPNFSESGTYTVIINLNDGFGAWTSRVVNLTVNDKEPNEILQFDFRFTSAQVPTWNSVNIAAPGFTHAQIADNKGNLTGVTLSIVKGTVAASTGGITTGSNSGPFPDAVVRDGISWGLTTNSNAQDTIQLKISGLEPLRTYNILFQSSISFNMFITYKIDAASIIRNAYNNGAGVDTLKNIQPNASGDVVITLIGDPGTTRGGILNALVVRANFADVLPPAKPLNLTGAHVANTGINLKWQDRAYNETGYYIFRGSTKYEVYTLLNNGATNKDSVSYNDLVVAPQTSYFYYVIGVNGGGMGISSDTIKVTTGNNAPMINSPATINVKTDAVVTSDFTITDDPGDVVSVSLETAYSFISLQDMGGSGFRITTSPNTDHIGVYTLTLKATDNKGASSFRNITLIVSDKNTRSVFVNFGSLTKTAPAPWNNWLGTKGSGVFLANLKDESNTITPFVINSLSPWSGLTDMGHLTGNNSGIYPDSVLQSGLVDITAPKTFRLDNLNNALKYNVVIVGSMNEGATALVEYASGPVKDTLNARYNMHLSANLNGLSPVNGQITITATRLTGLSVSYLNALVLEEYDPAVITILNPVNLYAEPLNRNVINLSWSDRTADEAVLDGYLLERASDSLFTTNQVSVSLPANTTEYQYIGLNANTKYWFRIRAKNSGGALSDYSNRTKAITPASLVSVNFNYTMPDAPYPWNNIYSSPTIEGSTFTNLINQSGTVSGLSLVLTKIFNGEFTAGVVTGNNSGPVPDLALASNFWLDNTQLSQFKLIGLNQSRRYRIGFWGSSSNPGWMKGNYTATYTVNGKTVYLNSWLNGSKMVYLSDLVPDDNGELLLDFSTTKEAQYGFNGGFIVQDYSDPQGGSNMNLILSNPTALAEVLGQDGNAANQLNNRFSSVNARMYPNPFVDFINLDFNNTSAGNNISMDVYDLSGRISYHKNFGKLPAGTTTLSLNGAEARMANTGVYIIALNVNGKTIQANKVIRSKN